MGIVTAAAGCGFGLIGLNAMVAAVVEPSKLIGREVTHVPNDDSWKQISRVAGRILAIVGIFILGWAGLGVGGALLNTARGVAYGAAFKHAFAMYAPDAIIGLGTYLVGEIARRLGGDAPRP